MLADLSKNQLNHRCISVGKDEEDYRPLFENFLQDLLVTLNRPDWPAAEVLLTLLGRLLVGQLIVCVRESLLCTMPGPLFLPPTHFLSESHHLLLLFWPMLHDEKI